MAYKLKSKEYYEEIKGKFNINCSEQYDRIRGKEFIGDNSWLFKHLQPTSYQDFFDKYVKCNIGESLDPNKRYSLYELKKEEKAGRSLKDLMALAKFYKRSCPHVDYPLEEFFDNIVTHAIIETLDGKRAEINLRDFYNSLEDYEVDIVDGDLDDKCGVDLIIRNKKDNTVLYIQVKPISTFLGNSNIGLIKDRIRFFKKQKNLNNALGEEHEILYMMYDKTHLDKTNEVLWFHKGDKNTFKLTELIDTNGNALNKYSDFVTKKLPIKNG